MFEMKSSLSSSQLKELKALAHRLAQASGPIIKKYFRSGMSVDLKGDATPVTIADKKAEEAIRAILQKEVPDHGIIGEELGSVNPEAKFTWVLDPIDGTRSFIHGSFDFGTLIALLENGRPILGVIDQPVLGQYLVGDNKSAELNGAPAKVRPCSKISETVLLTTDVYRFAKHRNGPAFDKLANEVKYVRTWGNAYGYALLAAGYVDVMIDPIMASWDLLALIPVVQGAGGIITDYYGGDPVTADSIVAASPGIHAEIVKALNPKPN